jgi:hypothetical protein
MYWLPFIHAGSKCGPMQCSTKTLAHILTEIRAEVSRETCVSHVCMLAQSCAWNLLRTWIAFVHQCLCLEANYKILLSAQYRLVLRKGLHTFYVISIQLMFLYISLHWHLVNANSSSYFCGHLHKVQALNCHLLSKYPRRSKPTFRARQSTESEYKLIWIKFDE